VEILRPCEAEARLSDLQDLLKTGPERGPVLQVLDDLDGFWKLRVEGWVHDVVAASLPPNQRPDKPTDW
jgi:hypothetical protein